MARASSAFCSTITIATPSRLTAATVSNSCSAARGARPADGSSSSNRIGATISAIAIARRAQQAGHDLEQRRLAGAVGADHAHDLPGVDAHVDALENLLGRRVPG